MYEKVTVVARSWVQLVTALACYGMGSSQRDAAEDTRLGPPTSPPPTLLLCWCPYEYKTSVLAVGHVIQITAD